MVGQKKHMDYSALNKEIRSGVIRPVYLLSGEEDWLIMQLTQSLIKAVIVPGSADLDLVQIDVAHQPQNMDTVKVEQEIRSLPFLSPRKMIILKNTDLFFSAKGAAKAQIDDIRVEIKELLESFPEDVVLIFQETKSNLSQKSLIAALEKAGGVRSEIGLQDSSILLSWVRSGCAGQGIQIESKAASSLIERCDGQMREIRGELDKLFLYLGWSGTDRIDMDLVELVCRPDNRSSIFDLTDAISANDAQKALRVLDTLLIRKEPVQLILFMLYRHIRQLLATASEPDSQKLISGLNLRPFVARKLKMQAQRFTTHRLAEIYELMFQTDMRIKQGQINDLMGLELLLVEAAAG